MESLVKLTVKTPNQRIDDVQINCDLQWTVRKLKEYLQDVYPSKPASSSQRLIYLGKLLQDHHLLKEVFGDWGNKTLHLVCAENNVDEAPSSESSTSTPAPGASMSGQSTSGNGSATMDSTDGLRHRGAAYQSNPNLFSGMQSPLTTAGTSMPNLSQWYQFHHQHQSMQQHPWSHNYHLQMQQYYQQYQQWQQWQMTMNNGQWPNQQLPNAYGQYSTPPSPLTPTSASSSESLLPPETQQPEQEPAVPEQPIRNEHQNQNAAMGDAVRNERQNQNVAIGGGMGGAIGGAMAEDEEDDNDAPRNRDWLDWLYMSMRVLMLSSIVYFYSSTTRFLMVALLGFIIYLYQGGWFTPRRRAPEPAVPPQNDANQENRNAENDNPDGQENNNETAPPVVVEPPPPPSALRILCTFFVSFVTSLIPTTPPALQQQ